MNKIVIFTSLLLLLSVITACTIAPNASTNTQNTANTNAPIEEQVEIVPENEVFSTVENEFVEQEYVEIGEMI
ncbi:hypothetical protein JXM83_02070 [Candidatus Woesearchaeota archaeon]|nr:hypothetical protein [Candidatus Woesearchaeota archaeon]